jgi:hypothetical protein
MDANFKLKQKQRGFDDPPLSNGLVYMVADKKLQEHLTHCSKTGQIAEVSILNCDGSYHDSTLDPSIRLIAAVLLTTRLVKPIQSTPRGTLSLVSAG